MDIQLNRYIKCYEGLENKYNKSTNDYDSNSEGVGAILTDITQGKNKAKTTNESKKVIQKANAVIRYADHKFAYGDNMCRSLAAKTRLLEEDKQGKVFEKFPLLKKDEEEKTLSKIIVRPDGTRMLLIIKNATVVNQFNLGKKELEE